MPLEMRGAAIVDPAGRTVRFAGFPTGRRTEAIVICEVTGEALRHIGNAPGAAGDKLLEIFEEYKSEIFRVASYHFDNGQHRPKVTISDLQNLGTQANSGKP